MGTTHGFVLLREQNIAEINTLARLYKHEKTGAELLSLINDDENKVFGIVFRTPPKDSTGVAHILEHAVLCGSRKYPVKEPFVELLKGSLKTFLNAFTYPDKTCYPVASQNVQDFYNLIDVYLDAVFYPRITPFIFQQEGWHFELESPDSPLTYKGVVLNEMKGAYSSPDSVLSEYSQQLLFPENTYGFDSGGAPKVIPTLTYEEFKAFHENYYHPSNARIYFYGNDDPEERLRILDAYLKDFEFRPVDSKVPLHPVLETPNRVIRSFAAGGDDTREKPENSRSKGMMTVNWLLADTTDTELNLSLKVLHYILLGMPGSPLRKALIDSGLGEDIAGVGLEDELHQTYFSTGLKGIAVENADRIESLILDTLEQLAREGIDPQTVEAALNTIEFRLRENNSGNYPRGLLLMLRALTTWLYDSDPLALLAFEGPLARLKEQLAKDLTYFPKIIEHLFLKNPHRVTIILKPDPELAEKEAAEERERLDAIRRSMSPNRLQFLAENTKALRSIQETPDPPEALATIPTLTISDLDKRNKTIPLAVSERQGASVLFHDIFTNGICYLDVGFDLHRLPQKYLPYVALLGRSFLEIGTEREDYVSLSQRISAKTGGIRPELFSSSIDGTDKSTVWLFLRAKSMAPRVSELFDILGDVLESVKLDNRDRFRQMVLEEKAKQEQRLVPNGHQVVGMRLRAHFSEADWAAEEMHGVSYLFFLRELSRRIDKDWDTVLSDLEEVRKTLVSRESMVFNFTVDQASWSRMESLFDGFLQRIPSCSIGFSSPQWHPELPPAFEGMTIPAQVNYVGKGANLYQLGYRFHGSCQVISGYLRNSWLWDRVRVQGGAYGAFCWFDRHSGAFNFVSYRDPNLLSTIDAFDRSADFLRNSHLSREELTKAIIGTIGQIDTYLLPDAKGFTSMIRHLRRETEEQRQMMRDQVLGTTAEDFRSFGDFLAEVAAAGIVKVLGSEEAIRDSLHNRPNWLNVLKLL